MQERLAQLTWFHQIALLEKLKSPKERLVYAAATIEHGWSRDILVVQIETGFLKRLGKAVNNFPRTLPKPQSDLAAQTLKDPYVFDFLELSGDVDERRLERGLVLVHHIVEREASGLESRVQLEAVYRAIAAHPWVRVVL